MIVIKLEIFPDEAEELRENTLWSIQTNRPAGIYFGHESLMEEDGRVVIALKSSVIKDPTVLVATAAHEARPLKSCWAISIWTEALPIMNR